MSTISTEERREVARRLREHSGVRLFTGKDVERLIGIELSGFRPKDADNSYNRLADLIEPEPERTCRDNDHIQDVIKCSECGEITLNTLYRVESSDGITVKGHRPRFCSNCGARVMDE